MDVHINVFGADQVRAADANGFSDPFCVIECAGRKEKTKPHRKTLNPKWEEKFKFSNVVAEETILFEIFDWDRLGRSTFLGEIKVPLSSLPKEEEVIKTFKLVTNPAKDKEEASGTLTVVFLLTFDTKAAPELKNDPTLRRRLTRHQSLQEVAASGKGQLIVELQGGRELASKDKNGLSDPYCIVNFAGQSRRSDIIYKTLNPEWFQEFFFEVAAPGSDVLVEIWDWDRVGGHDAMGQVIIPWREFEDGEVKEIVKVVVPQKKEKVSGQIQLSLQYTSAKAAETFYRLATKEAGTFLPHVLSPGNPDFPVLTALCNAYDSNELAAAAVTLMASEKKAYPFLLQFAFQEVKSTNSEGTLFRTDCIFTKTTIAWLKLIQAHYNILKNVLAPLVEDLMSNYEGYEVDPAKPGYSESNVPRLEGLCQRFLNVILDVCGHLPDEIKEHLANIKALAGQKFPVARLKSVGAILFLRFFCPAIIAPDGFGYVAGPPPPAVRRVLTLVAKPIQNLANQVEFGSKEQFMLPFNEFVKANKDRLDVALETASTVNNRGNYSIADTITPDQKTQNLAIILKNLASNKGGLLKALEANPRLAPPEKMALAQAAVQTCMADLAKHGV